VRGRIRRGLLTGAVLLVAASTVIAGDMSGSPPLLRAQPGEDPVLLRELAERLLSPPPDVRGEAPRARLFPGALPPGLEIDLPVPPGVRLIGSVQRGAPGSKNVVGVEVVLDAPGTPAEVAAFYQRALGERGWFAPPGGGPPTGGFQPTAGPLYRMFCAGSAGPFLTLSVYPVRDGPTDVRLSIPTGAPGPCGETPSRPPHIPFDLLPALTVPEGVAVTTVTTGPNRPGTVSSDAIAETGLSPAALEAHFAAQLAAAGWTRVDGGAQGRLAWSAWQVPGEGEWEGFLYVLDGPGAGCRSLHLHIATPRTDAVPFK
jgi:hypothetical protein